MNDAHSHLVNCILIRVNIIFQLKQSCFSLSSCLIHFNTSTSKSSRFSISEKKNLINVSIRCFIDRFFLLISFSFSNTCTKNSSTSKNICHSFFFLSRFFFFFNGNQTKSMGEEKERIKCCYSLISTLSLSPSFPSTTCCSLELMHTRERQSEQ